VKDTASSKKGIKLLTKTLAQIFSFLVCLSSIHYYYCWQRTALTSLVILDFLLFFEYHSFLRVNVIRVFSVTRESLLFAYTSIDFVDLDLLKSSSNLTVKHVRHGKEKLNKNGILFREEREKERRE